MIKKLKRYFCVKRNLFSLKINSENNKLNENLIALHGLLNDHKDFIKICENE
jgi:hypothetical protein